MRANILLIQPYIGYSASWLNLLRKVENISLPLSLLRISSFLHDEYNIKIIDQRTDKDWKENILRELRKKPICVGVAGGCGIQIKYALECSKVVKENSDVPVVWGGVHASLMPRQTLENSNIDIVVQGEGELTFYELVRILNTEECIEKVKGIWYKKNGLIYQNSISELLDLNILPIIPYHLINMNRYITNKLNFTFPLQSSRGCPQRCIFCYNEVYNRGKFRSMSPEKTLEHIAYIIDNFGIKYFRFFDDNFFADLKRAEEIVGGIINLKKKYGVYWDSFGSTISSHYRMNESFLDLLEKSCCRSFYIGVESGSQRILDFIKKDIEISQVSKVNDMLKKRNFHVYYAFMAGFPTETLDELKQTIKLALKLIEDNPNAQIAGIKMFHPIYNTESHKMAKEYNFEFPSTLEDWIYRYEMIDLPWFSKKENYRLKSIWLTSNFLGKPVGNNYPLFLKPLIYLYKPIAKLRLKHLFFKFFIIEKIAGKIFSLFYFSAKTTKTAKF